MRCFVAIELPDAARRQLAKLIAGFPRGEVKWCCEAQLHVTLKFLGDVADGDVPRVCDAIAAASAALSPFELKLTHLRAFPLPARPRVLHCALEDVLRGCQRWLDAADPALEELGIARESRPFTPHVTLGRSKGPGGTAAMRSILARPAAELARSILAAPFRVEEVVLFESRLQPAGAVYSVVQRAALG